MRTAMHLLPISKLPGNRLTYVAFALVLALSAVSARPTRGVVRDVPLIVCELCPLLAAAAFPADGDISSEVAVLDGVEDMCDPKKKPGRWLRSLDLVEKRKRLRVQKVDGVAACEVECRTAALACTDIVDKAGATDIADLIYSGASKEKVAKWLCAGSDGGASRACKGRAPYIWKGRPEGPAFSPISEKDLQMEDLMANLPPGMASYDASNFPGAGGGDDDDDDDDDDGGKDNSSPKEVDGDGPDEPDLAKAELGDMAKQGTGGVNLGEL